VNERTAQTPKTIKAPQKRTIIADIQTHDQPLISSIIACHLFSLNMILVSRVCVIGP
jgi:hypothetical protein